MRECSEYRAEQVACPSVRALEVAPSALEPGLKSASALSVGPCEGPKTTRTSHRGLLRFSRPGLLVLGRSECYVCECTPEARVRVSDPPLVDIAEVLRRERPKQPGSLSTVRPTVQHVKI
jgi:hypothetical protein